MTTEETLPMGVTIAYDKSGRKRYKVSAGSKSRRRTYTFDTKEEAIGFQNEYRRQEPARQASGLPGLTRAEFDAAARGGPSALQPAATFVPIAVTELVDKMGNKLIAEQRSKKGLKSQLNILRRFLVQPRGGIPDLGRDIESWIIDAKGRLDLCDTLDGGERKRVARYYREESGVPDDKRWQKFEVDASDVTVGWAEELPGWLYACNYDQGTQARVIELADQIWQKARKHKLVEENVFEGLTRNKCDLPKYNRLGKDRKQEEAPAWSVEQICALARVLRPIYLLPFWLCVGMGFRLAEPFGFKLADWNSADSELYVGYQRPASAAKGRRPLKVPKSERPLPVPGVLAQCIDRYIAENHPPRPTDPTALITWGDRYLLVGAQGGAMDARSFALAVSGSYQLLGITSELYGYFRPVHHLRKTLGGVLQVAARQAGFPASAVSILLGHLVKDEAKSGRPARTTERFYSPKVVGEIGRLIAFLDRWICVEVMVALGTSDLLDIAGMDDPISLDRAVELLNKSGLDHDVHDVLRHAELGTVVISRVNFTNDAVKQEPVVSEASVLRLLCDLDRETSDTYSATEVATLLQMDHRAIYRLVAQGEIVETTTDSRKRRGAPGYNTGTLPGGGRRFPKESVDEFAALHEERIERAQTWLSVGEAAEVIGCSSETVRRRADAGHFTLWRDPLSAHRVRRLDPKEVLEYAAMVAEVSVGDAAAALGVPEARIRAWLKCGQLTAGSRKSRVLCSSIEQVQERGQGASASTSGAPANSASSARDTGADRLAS